MALAIRGVQNMPHDDELPSAPKAAVARRR